MRRLVGGIALAVVTVGASWLAAPQQARAYSEIAAVSYPAGTFEDVGFVDWGASGRTCDPGETDTAWMSKFYAPASQTWPPDANFYGWRTSFGDLHGQVWGGGPYGCRMHGSSAGHENRYRFDPTVGVTYRFIFQWAKNTNDPWQTPSIYWVGSGGTSVGTIQAPLTDADGGTGWATVSDAAPSGAIGVGWAQTEANTYQLALSVEGTVTGGDCSGVGDLDEGSVTGSPSAGWGVYWSATREACLSAYSGWQTVLYIPPPGFPVEPYFEQGVGYCLRDEWVIPQDTEVGRPRVRAYWVDFSGDTIGVIYSYYAGTGTATVCKEAPGGAYGVAWVMEADAYQVSHGIGLAEGDDLETYGNGEKPIASRTRNQVPDYFAQCEVPVAGELPILGDLVGFLIGEDAQFTNPIDYIPYGICLMVAGFKTVVDWLADVPGLVAEFLGDAFAAALDAAVTLMSDALEFLFVPTEVGDAWEEFLATLDSRVPFGWVSQVYGFLSGGLTGGNLAGASVPTSLAIMGATIPVDFSMVFGELGWLRTILAGVIYLGCGMAIWRSVGRTLGGQG